jgi:hypothetical protein
MNRDGWTQGSMGAVVGTRTYMRSPPESAPGAESSPRQLTYDYAFFQQHCA